MIALSSSVPSVHLRDILVQPHSILTSAGLLDRELPRLYHHLRVQYRFQPSFRSMNPPRVIIPLRRHFPLHLDHRQYHQGIKAPRLLYPEASDNLSSLLSTASRLLRLLEPFHPRLPIQSNPCQSRKSLQSVSLMVVPRCQFERHTLVTHHYPAILPVSHLHGGSPLNWLSVS